MHEERVHGIGLTLHAYLDLALEKREGLSHKAFFQM
jgi:hypothetical protein